MDRKCPSSAAILISAIAFSGAAALATPIVVVTSGTQRIRTFDSATPGIFATDQLITGLMAGDVINAIDRRPSNSQIYGLTSNSNRIYTLDASTGAATFVSTAGIGAGGNTGFDFDPVAEAAANPSLRVSGGLITGTTAMNARVNVATGATTSEGPFSFAPGDVHAGVPPVVPAMAYTNNVPGASTTTLYGLVSLPGGASVNPPVLVRVPDPSTGVMNTVGSIGVLNVNFLQGLDIGSDGTAYAALGTPGGSQLYTINLATGAASLVGTIGNGTPVVGIATSAVDAAAVPEPAATLLFVSGMAVFATLRRRS